LNLSETTSELIFEKYRDKIYPWVKTFSKDITSQPGEEALELSHQDFPVYKEWLGDVAIFYVVDLEENYQMILNRDMPKGMTNEQLHELSLVNLERDIEYRLHDADFGGYCLIARGNHEANSVCLPERWKWLTGHLNDNLIVAIPAKDLILIAHENDADKIANLKISVHEIFKNGERLLTRNIFRVDKESIEWSIVDRVN